MSNDKLKPGEVRSYRIDEIPDDMFEAIMAAEVDAVEVPRSVLQSVAGALEYYNSHTCMESGTMHQALDKGKRAEKALADLKPYLGEK